VKLEIDYASHPAFRDLMHGSQRSSPAARRYFDGVDELWRECVTARFAGRKKEASSLFDEREPPLRAALSQALAEAVDETYLPFLNDALAESAQAIRKEIAYVAAARGRPRRYSTKAGAIREELSARGAVAFRLEPERRRRIVASLAPFMEQLREQRRTNGGARCFVAVPAWGEHWNEVKAFVRANRVEEGISAFAGYPLELGGYALTYSHPDETWYQNCYGDIALPTAATVQMHFDRDNLSAKSMLYLNDVEPDSGPFSYVPGSREIIPSRSQLSFFKGLGNANGEFAKAKHSAETSYNRPLFIDPSLRPYFARLPLELQGSAGPGDDVVDDTALSKFLRERERPITSEDGDLALFAGGETLHRGGVTRRGERWALQMLYSEPPSLRQHVTYKLRSFARRIIKGPR
jgi:ectoine hydroxylase-related dioxygenase (phytanoyl-CoA dioxygenase family)